MRGIDLNRFEREFFFYFSDEMFIKINSAGIFFLFASPRGSKNEKKKKKYINFYWPNQEASTNEKG
jgi:hypothetical protein